MSTYRTIWPQLQEARAKAEAYYILEMRRLIKSKLFTLKPTEPIKIQSKDGDAPYIGVYTDCILEIEPDGSYKIWNSPDPCTEAHEACHYSTEDNVETLGHILYTLDALLA
jgi:hypothetical protein